VVIICCDVKRDDSEVFVNLYNEKPQLFGRKALFKTNTKNVSLFVSVQKVVNVCRNHIDGNHILATLGNDHISIPPGRLHKLI
jgi:hypothetical protein